MKSNDPGATGRALNTGHNRDHPTEDEVRQLATELGIDLAEIFRPARAYPRFELGHSQVAEKVAAGEIEPPIPLTETGHAVGWTGRQGWRFTLAATSIGCREEEDKVAA